MTNRFRIIVWVAVPAVWILSMAGRGAAPAPGLLDGLHWRAPLDHASAWGPQPGWLSNSSKTARVTASNSLLAFRVPEPKRGMKWSRRVPSVWLPESPILVVRYRATNMVTDRDDYAVYLDDGGPRELRAVRLNQLVSDGQWHRIAVDVRALTPADTVTALAVQVQAARPDAVLEITELRFAAEPPAGCTVLGSKRKPVAAPRRDALVPLERLAWKHRSSWLANPVVAAADVPAASRPRFTVAAPGRGMKWHALLAQPIPLTAYRYLVLRYRARDLIGNHDYAVCVLGSRGAGGESYTALAGLDALVPDGRAHVLVIDISGAARLIPKAEALAVQVQAATPNAMIELAGLRFSQQRPKLALSDFVSVTPGAMFTPGVLEPVSLSTADSFDLRPVLAHLGIGAWVAGRTSAIAGIPFRLGPAPPRAQGVALEVAGGRISVPVSGRATEVYLFVLAVLSGAEAPVYGGGQFEAIADRDRFLAGVRYAHGPSVEALPLSLESGKCELRNGPQVLCVPLDSTRDLAGIDLILRSPQAAVALCAATVRRSGPRQWSLRPSRLSMPPARKQPPRQRVQVAGNTGTIRLSCATFEAVLALTPVPRLVRFRDLISGVDLIAGETPPPLAELFVDDGKHRAAGLGLRGPPERVDGGVRLTCEDAGFPGVQVLLTVRCVPRDAVRPDRLEFSATENRAGDSASGLPGLRCPQVGPFHLAPEPKDVWVLFPSRDSVFSNRDHGLSGYYSGLFPLQFMAAAAPGANQGVCLLTEDEAGKTERRYGLQKAGGTVRLDLEYPALPGSRNRRDTVLTWITPTGGDWHAGFNFYRKWLKTWYKPAAPRLQWFREVFNFRQRFLHSNDPLYDAQTGSIDLLQAIEEANAFGGIEYLHLFDWGNCGKYGRIYGRTGDFSPYDYLKGGRAALAAAVDRLQRHGTPVGLYIEGYLLQEKGRLGQAHGREWQIRGPADERRYWPESTEMFICPGVRDWRKVQASTYAQKVRELGVSGMYMDEFGFCGPNKKCWAPDHGHPVPSFPVRTERQSTREVRTMIDHVKKGVALYSEETPCDVNSQYQDGSFSYSVRQSFLHRRLVPINLTRFAIPSFKIFQILVCDKPTATFANGVEAVFFNGDGLWLEGPAATWFGPRTLATIQRCHKILHAHRKAFACDAPEPLVPTVAPGVFANRFDGPGETVFTLFNSGFEEVSGPVLRVPRREAVSVLDAWEGRPVTPATDGDWAVIPASIAPRSVGCLVCRPGGHRR